MIGADAVHSSLKRATALFRVSAPHEFSEQGVWRRFESRPLLRAGLERRIYWRCHLGLDGAEEPARGDVRGLEDVGLIDSLIGSLGNCSYPDWGWTSRVGKLGLVQKDGLTLQVESSHLIWRPSSTPNQAPEAGVRLPCYRRFAVPGYFLAIGSSGPPRQADRVRLYLNAGSANAIELVVDLIRSFDSDGHEFEIKVLNNPGLYYRCDSIVCYLNRCDADAMFARVAEVASGRLRSPTPGFAERLAPGLARASDRSTPNALSFGQHRSRLVADALIAVDTSANAESSNGQRLVALANAVAACGLDPAAPYRDLDTVSRPVHAGHL